MLTKEEKYQLNSKDYQILFLALVLQGLHDCLAKSELEMLDCQNHLSQVMMESGQRGRLPQFATKNLGILW